MRVAGYFIDHGSHFPYTLYVEQEQERANRMAIIT